LPPAQNSHKDQRETSAPPAQSEDQPPVIEVTATYSARAVLRHKDFADLSLEELDEVKSLIASFIWQLGERRTRRYQRGGSTDIDMRRSIRRNLRYGGEMIQWAYRQPADKPRPLVVLDDISGSMDRDARLLLRFCFSMAHSLKQPVETFPVQHSPDPYNRQLRHRNLDAALADIGQAVSDWSGGTRIGEALKTFNIECQRVLGRGAVILISDG
jgi:uncharacterized protein with von Willebrand factor type A (vWA) domain